MKTYRVEGMTCGGCEASLRRLMEQAGLEVATISHREALVSISAPHDAETVARVVSTAGFTFEGPVEQAGA